MEKCSVGLYAVSVALVLVLICVHACLQDVFDTDELISRRKHAFVNAVVAYMKTDIVMEGNACISPCIPLHVHTYTSIQRTSIPFLFYVTSLAIPAQFIPSSHSSVHRTVTSHCRHVPLERRCSCVCAVES